MLPHMAKREVAGGLRTVCVRHGALTRIQRCARGKQKKVSVYVRRWEKAELELLTLHMERESS